MPEEPVAVGVPGSTVAPAQSVVSTSLLGGQLMVGAALSSTVTVNEQAPPPVVDVTVTVVVPTGKKEPDCTLDVKVPQSPTLSVPGNVTLAPEVEPWVVLAETVMLFGQSRVHVALLAPPAETVADDEAVLSGV